MNSFLFGEFYVPYFQKGSILNINGQEMTIINVENYSDSGTDDYGYPCSVNLIYVTEVDTGNPELNAAINAALESDNLRIEHHIKKEENEGDYEGDYYAE